MSAFLIVGQQWSALTRDVVSCSQTEFVPITLAQFSDTEVFVTINDSYKAKGMDVLLIYQLSHFKADVARKGILNSINDQLMGAFQVIDLLQSMEARSIRVFFPYLPYSRQDESVCKKYQGAVFMIGRCLKALGVKNAIACQLHAPKIVSTYPIPLHNIELESFWKNAVMEHIIAGKTPDSFCIVSPDKGGQARAEQLASLLGMDCAVINKTRIAPDTAVVCELNGNVRGKHTILVDDIIDTGRTAVNACNLLLENGARTVYGCFTHMVLSDGARERLEYSKFKQILVSDTIDGVNWEATSRIRKVSLNGHLAEYVVKWMNNEQRI